MKLIKPDRRAELMKMTKEQIIDYIEVCNKNFWSLQNNWMANVTMKYGSEVAAEMDEKLWAKWSAVEAHRLKKLLNLGNMLTDVRKVLTFSLAAEGGLEGGYSEITDKKVVWKVTRCPMQLARREAGWPELNCKPVFVAIWKAIIGVINADIKLAEVYAPPDPHKDDDWCGATLQLE